MRRRKYRQCRSVQSIIGATHSLRARVSAAFRLSIKALSPHREKIDTEQRLNASSPAPAGRAQADALVRTRASQVLTFSSREPRWKALSMLNWWAHKIAADTGRAT